MNYDVIIITETDFSDDPAFIFPDRPADLLRLARSA
jgi:hypothetical protein